MVYEITFCKYFKKNVLTNFNMSFHMNSVWWKKRVIHVHPKGAVVFEFPHGAVLNWLGAAEPLKNHSYINITRVFLCVSRVHA